MLMKNQYAIQNKEDKRYLSTIYIGTKNYVTPLSWAYTETQAKHFSTKEEAKATIDFIEAVIDWEQKEHLQIIETEH